MSKSYGLSGKGPIPVGWLDVKNGDEGAPELRSRLAAKEVKQSAQEDMFAATPPVEANIALRSRAVTSTRNTKKPRTLIFVDVQRAYVFAPNKRPVFV